MDERIGHEMLVARCKALEAVALHYLTLLMYEQATEFSTPEQLKQCIERDINKDLGQ